VSVDTTTGQRRVIYAPNSGFSRLTLGSIRRIEVKNAYGIKSFADLILPPNHHAGDKHPLVVVQYSSRGFLRGGTGDEVPIQLLANRGLAVLSFDKPGFYALTKAPHNEEEFRRISYAGWMDRRSIFSSLEESVRLAVATGTVDPQRVGISGFSDGVETVQFALINSTMFSVAAIGGCCNDQWLPALVGGPGYQQHQRSQGLPAFDVNAKDYWAPMSLHQHADELHTPILAQMADSEYTLALDVEAAWRSRGNPFELYVFPNETHVKWQPSHRLAIYERVSDWFSFWLLNKVDCNANKNDQYDRWFKMKGAPDRAASSCLATSPIP
jgi:dipeptidyl aminopeptidase/acylaminoacyl peptidase